MTCHHTRMCLLGVWMTTHNFKGFNTQKREWLGIFQPNWQNYKIAIFPAVKIGSTPNFDTVTEPRSWLRGLSRITKFKFKMVEGRHIAKCWKRCKLPVRILESPSLLPLPFYLVYDLAGMRSRALYIRKLLCRRADVNQWRFDVIPYRSANEVWSGWCNSHAFLMHCCSRCSYIPPVKPVLPSNIGSQCLIW